MSKLAIPVYLSDDLSVVLIDGGLAISVTSFIHLVEVQKKCTDGKVTKMIAIK